MYIILARKKMMTKKSMKAAWAHCKTQVKKGKIPKSQVKKCVFRSFKK